MPSVAPACFRLSLNSLLSLGLQIAKSKSYLYTLCPKVGIACILGALKYFYTAGPKVGILYTLGALGLVWKTGLAKMINVLKDVTNCRSLGGGLIAANVTFLQ